MSDSALSRGGNPGVIMAAPGQSRTNALAWTMTRGQLTPIQKLTLRQAHWQAMLQHVRQHGREEACGLLSGANGRAEQLYLIENALHSPVEYYMDPVQQVRAMLEIEAAGLEVCAIFHSHPAGP